MLWFVITVLVVLASCVLEYFLSYRANKWHGLILPIAFFCAASVFLGFNLSRDFLAAEDYGLFLIQYGSAGLYAMVLKVGFLYAPFAAQLIIFFVRRHFYRKNHEPVRHNKELKKMLVDDL